MSPFLGGKIVHDFATQANNRRRSVTPDLQSSASTVVLPEPEGPTKARHSPCCTSKLSSETALREARGAKAEARGRIENFSQSLKDHMRHSKCSVRPGGLSRQDEQGRTVTPQIRATADELKSENRKKSENRRPNQKGMHPQIGTINRCRKGRPGK
jgi:hypothetical protein